MNKKIFKTRCPKCHRYAIPLGTMEFKDRILFYCRNKKCQKNPPIIKLLNGAIIPKNYWGLSKKHQNPAAIKRFRNNALKKNYLAFKNKLEKSASKSWRDFDSFLTAAHCLAHAIMPEFSEMEELVKDCKKCPRIQKKMCHEIEHLSKRVCKLKNLYYEVK